MTDQVAIELMKILLGGLQAHVTMGDDRNDGGRLFMHLNNDLGKIQKRTEEREKREKLERHNVVLTNASTSGSAIDCTTGEEL